MAVLENLEPKKVFHFFEEISEVPRGTFNIKGISDYCTKFAKDRNLEVVQDEVGNVVIKKPGTTGYENSEFCAIITDSLNVEGATRHFADLLEKMK